MELLFITAKNKGFVPLICGIDLNKQDAMLSDSEIERISDLIVLEQMRDWLREYHNIDITIETDMYNFSGNVHESVYFGIIPGANNQEAKPKKKYIDALKQVIERAIYSL